MMPGSGRLRRSTGNPRRSRRQRHSGHSVSPPAPEKNRAWKVLQAGADDYLVKPFTARELIARVATHVKIARFRREAEKARRLYDTILSNTPDLAYVFDRNHKFIYANNALLAMWGRSVRRCHRQKLPGAGIRAVACGDARPRDRSGHRYPEASPRRSAVYRHQRPPRLRLHLRSRDGTQRRGGGHRRHHARHHGTQHRRGRTAPERGAPARLRQRNLECRVPHERRLGRDAPTPGQELHRGHR